MKSEQELDLNVDKESVDTNDTKKLSSISNCGLATLYKALTVRMLVFQSVSP